MHNADDGSICSKKVRKRCHGQNEGRSQPEVARLRERLQLSPKKRLFAMFRKFTAEEELLLCCARTRLETPTAARVGELLKGGIDWDRLTVLAHQHSVTQLLYWHLIERVQDVAPTAFTQELQRDFRANVDRNLYLAGELLRLLPLFETNGIPVIAFKGPVFAVNVYKNIALRTFDDLDILLRKHDRARATTALASASYLPWHSESHVRDTLDLRQHAMERMFVNVAQEHLQIDVHWDLLGPQDACKLDVAEVFRHARLTQLFSRKVRTLSLEDALLFSCIHATQHVWIRLSWICDIAEIIRALPPISWEGLVEKANHAHSRRMLDVGLLAAADLLDAPVPGHVLHRIKRDSSAEKLVEQVKWRLFDEGTLTPERVHAVRQMAMKERRADKLKIFLWFALVPIVSDYDAVRLPPQIIGLYFAIHPLRLALQFALTGPQLTEYGL
jgi:hypothetical protein